MNVDEAEVSSAFHRQVLLALGHSLVESASRDRDTKERELNIHDVYRPFQLYFRKRRMAQFQSLFDVTDETRIIDVGGYEMNWSLIDRAPSVQLVNLEDENWERGQFRKAKGDGRCLQWPDNSFDIAYSNSVIEHVGDAADQRAFAREIRRVAPRYYVQTPNRGFFLEPHFVGVGLHWMPPAMARRLIRPLSVWGWVNRPSQVEIDELLSSIRLLDRREFQALFPDAEIIEETVMGMTKSLIAIRR